MPAERWVIPKESRMANSQNMIAGVSAGGTSGAELLWLAPAGTDLTALRTAPFGDLATEFVSPGYCTQDGFSISQDLSKEEIYSYGVQTPTRVLKTQMKTTGSITLQETNSVSLAVYNGLPLTGEGALVVGQDGTVTVEVGKIRSQRYAAVIDARDGATRTRLIMPDVEIFPAGDLQLSMGAILERALEITAYPDSNGVAIYESHTGLVVAGSTVPPATP